MMEIECRDGDERRAIRQKLDKRILPWLFALGVVCYLDRTNLSYAAVELNRDLQFSCKTYGLGAGLFFLGYAVCQVPSSRVFFYFGMPYLCSTIILWGIVAGSFALVQSSTAFLLLRVLLGVFESGTFPCMWAYLARFYSPEELGASYAYISTSTALAQIIGSPIAAGILLMDGFGGISGWQWLFIIEGITSVCFGIILYHALPSAPKTALFLTPEDREWLQEKQDGYITKHQTHKDGALSTIWRECCRFWTVMKDWRTLYLSVVLFAITQAMYGCVFFIPMIIHSFFFSSSSSQEGDVAVSACSDGESSSGSGEGAVVAILSMVPFASAAICMIIVRKMSESANERRYHAAIPVCLGAIFMMTTPGMMHLGIPVMAFISLTLAAAALWSYHGPFMTWPVVFFERENATLAFAIMNSIGSAGGFFGNTILGILAEATGGYGIAMVCIGIVLLLGGLAIILMPRPEREMSRDDVESDTLLGEQGALRRKNDEMTTTGT
ncbi:hypothetical protein M9434_004904 [Picochlorum sp. BPE23]|nr:hypothetical protein M9434_004904 [Picochlorum sp. BPE23]